jgi:hypothetical protein
MGWCSVLAAYSRTVRTAVVIGVLVGACAVSPTAPAAADLCANGYLARCQQQNGPARPRTDSTVSWPVGELPRVQAVPCSGSHLGVCIALTPP